MTDNNINNKQGLSTFFMWWNERNYNFRKMAKVNKEKWCCAKCKSLAINTSITLEDDSFVGSNETLSNLTESVKFMRNQFDMFGKQLSEVLNSIKKFKKENESLKEINCKLNVDIGSLTKKINVLEQNAAQLYAMWR